MNLEVFFSKQAVAKKDEAQRILVAAYQEMQGVMGDIDVETLTADWYGARKVRDDFDVGRLVDAIRQAAADEKIFVTGPIPRGTRIGIYVDPVAPPSA